MTGFITLLVIPHYIICYLSLHYLLSLITLFVISHYITCYESLPLVASLTCILTPYQKYERLEFLNINYPKRINGQLFAFFEEYLSFLEYFCR